MYQNVSNNFRRWASDKIWSGVVDYGHSDYTYATANIQIPTYQASCPHQTWAAHWVGVGNNGLLQNGIAAIQGQLQGASLWWEAINPKTRHDTGMVSVAQINTAGHIIPTSTTYDGSRGVRNPWITFHWYDATARQGYPNVIFKPGVAGYYDGTQAEFVNERPSINGQPALMRNWGTQVMYGGFVGWGSTTSRYAFLDTPTWDGIDMTSDGTYKTHIMSEMYSIDTDHNFKTYWHHCS